MTESTDAEIRRLLDRAFESMDRGAWDATARLAARILTLRPDNEDAAALLRTARIRMGRAQDLDPATRRQVTVMFCDMVGSTALSTQLDPEQQHEVLRGFLAPCVEVVEEFDGYVASLLGDGLLAYFGVPHAQEDSAARAIFAGCRIVQRIRELPPVVLSNGVVRLAVRVGIHTGLAMVSPAESTQRMQTNQVVGETPNLAARLQSVAADNAVVVSAETSHLVRDLFEMQLLPEQTLKGIRRRVDVLRVVGPRVVESRFDAAFRLRTRLVGRRREQEAIGEAWSRTLDSGRMTLALLGEAGIGKSRLLAYARAHVKATGGRHRTLQCSPYHLSTPLHPVAAVMQREAGEMVAGGEGLLDLAARLGFADVASMAALGRLLRVRLPTDVAAADMTPEELRERTLALALTWLEQLADRSPLLLGIEDLHWADPTTLELLSRFVASAAPTPMLVILTSRERPPLERIGGATTLTLEPLGQEDCAGIVEDVMGDDRLPARTFRTIVDRSDGVPLYVEELTRMLQLAAHTPHSAITESGVPSSLVELMVARLDQHPAELGLAQVIATVGQPVSTGLLSRLLTVTSDELRRQLDVLVDARLLRVLGDRTDPLYEFRHVLQRDAAYELQLHRRRRTVHAAIAAALAGEEGASGAPELLAHHHELAEDFAAAAHHWYRAGLQHSAVAAHAEAIQHYRRSLAALARTRSEMPVTFELDVQGGLAFSLLAANGYTSDEVVRAYKRLRELSAGPDNWQHKIPSLFGTWAYHNVRGENDVTGELAEQLLDAASASGDPQHVLAARNVKGYQLLVTGGFREAVELFEETRRWRPGDGPLLFPLHVGAAADIFLATALWIIGVPRRARMALAEAVARADSYDGPTADFTRAHIHCYAASLCHIAGFAAGYVWHADRTIAIATERGFATWLGAGLLHRAVALALTGRAGEHVGAIREGLDVWRAAGAESYRSQFLLGLSEALIRAGQQSKAIEAVDEALTHVARTGERFLESPLHRLRGDLLYSTAPDEPAAAAAELLLAAEVARRQGARAFELAALSRLREVEGRPGAAETGPVATGTEVGPS
jgi:class 3 adenylate cyclase/tetratricopeptide (TPR) repeat protein